MLWISLLIGLVVIDMMIIYSVLSLQKTDYEQMLDDEEQKEWLRKHYSKEKSC